MKRIRIILMVIMLFTGMGSHAQTVVEFVAGVDKGRYTEFDRLGLAGSERLEKDGVVMSCSNATFASEKYSVRLFTYLDLGRTLSFTSENKDIASIEFVDCDNLATFRCSGYDSETGKWTGRTTNVDLSIVWGASFSKVIITLYDRPATKLSFDRPVMFNYIEQQMNTIPAPTLKCDDEVLTGLPLTYKNSNPSVADILITDGAATIVPKTEGSAVITAKFEGDDKYDISNEAQFTLNVVNGKNIFHESFDNISGTGGHDGNFDYTSWNDGLSSDKFDNTGWNPVGVEFLGSWAYNAVQCVRIEMGAGLTTPALRKLSGDAFLIFRAAQNRNEPTNVNLSISGGGTLEQESVPLVGQKFADYTVLVKDATPETKITFSCGFGGSLYLDDVKVERAIVLDAAADNSQTLKDNASMADGATVNALLRRNLSSKCWNTLCLPFDVKKEDIAGMFGQNTFVVALDYYNAAENSVCFKLTDGITAGTPCMIWPGSDITAIMAKNVMPTDKVHNVMSNGVSFKGIYNPTVISYNDVVFDSDNRFSSPDETEGSNSINGFNAYFTGLTNADAAVFKINGNVNAINEVNADQKAAAAKVYTIDGRHIGNSAGKLAKGIYIVGGKKVFF